MTAFWSTQLVLALVLNCVVQAIQIGAYAARLAGVRTGRIATSISLFNLFVTASRLANLFYALMLGPLSDRSRARGAQPLDRGRGDPSRFEIAAPADRPGRNRRHRAGRAAAADVHLSVPARRASFERLGSVPHAVARLGDPRVIGDVIRSMRPPPRNLLNRFRLATCRPGC